MESNGEIIMTLLKKILSYHTNYGQILWKGKIRVL